MLTAATLAGRREDVAASADLSALLATLHRRVERLLAEMPTIPEQKALLSTDGGVCPDDGGALVFDPWSPTKHRCSRCGHEVMGQRHDGHWARFQHLWLAEQAANLATVAVLGDDEVAARRAQEILRVYGERYLRYPNRDNVLGPARLFFSTYLESIWVTDYLAAAVMLREADLIDPPLGKLITQLADEAATLIGEFDEGFSNRQTWHNAALAALAAWFEDESLARQAIEGQTGLLAHLVRGFADDGMWYEGENYHLFALRGLLVGIGWAKLAGVELATEPALAERIRAALLAPALTALPDGTFPARKDSRFGVSLAQPMYLELWEVGRAYVGGEELDGWLAHLYRTGVPAAETFDSYLHEAGMPAPVERTRRDLSWWALVNMPAALGAAAAWKPPSLLLESQGLAILRRGDRYVSLECGVYGGGHGHPDRLHLTLHADGVHWLPDYGTGSYVSRDLFWYRSTLAHNAPRLDGASQAPGDAACEAFDVGGDWSWARGRYGGLTRTVVAGPRYLVDVVEFNAEEEHELELAWHPAGRVDVATPGRWVADRVEDTFVSGAERLEPETAGTIVARATADSAALAMHFAAPGTLLRATAPGAPNTAGAPAPMLIERGAGRWVRAVSVLEPVANGEEAVVRELRIAGGVIEVVTAAGVDRHTIGERWQIETAGTRVTLAGTRRTEPPPQPLFSPNRDMPPVAVATWIDEAPALDGSLDGFALEAPIALETEDQYRRSEEPYPGPDEFSATAWMNWTEDTAFFAIEVTKPEPTFRPADAAPLRLDNEPDDINSDGAQLYLRDAAGDVLGWLVVPEEGGALRARPIAGTVGAAEMTGAWALTENGYRVTLAVRLSHDTIAAAPIGFDLIVNEMLPGRVRRSGQLVWTGGGGWVWLRGDRHDSARFGLLELER